jgi:hypothetical protein
MCGTDEHNEAKQFAWIAICVFPIGLFALNAALLFCARKAIYFKQATMLSQATRFLHHEYKQVCPSFCSPSMLL